MKLVSGAGGRRSRLSVREMSNAVVLEEALVRNLKGAFTFQLQSGGRGLSQGSEQASTTIRGRPQSADLIAAEPPLVCAGLVTTV